MRLDRLDLLDRFSGYLEGDKVDEFLELFGVKLGSGTWVAGDFVDRFMVRGYNRGFERCPLEDLEGCGGGY